MSKCTHYEVERVPIDAKENQKDKKDMEESGVTCEK